jgi:hypothetical protein
MSSIQAGKVRIARFAVCVCAMALSGTLSVGAVPAAPGTLTGTVVGNTIALHWFAPPGAVLDYQLDAGTGPGATNVGSFPIGSATSFAASGIPAGTYYVRVRARDVTGVGLPSNEVVLVVGGGGTGGGCSSAPGPVTGLTATLNGFNVVFSWSAGGGCAATNYALQAGTAPGLANIATVSVGTQTSFSASAPPGTYYVRVVAQNAFGSTVSTGIVVTVGGSSGVPLVPLAGTVTSLGHRTHLVTMPTTGQYNATLTWADGSVDLDLYLTTTPCGTSWPPSNACLRARSAADVGNSEQISFPVVAGQAYYVWVDNFTSRSAIYSVQHSVTPGVSAAVEAAAYEADAVALPSITKSKP